MLSQISDCIILGGDFNLPDMKWDSDCVAPQKNRNCSAFSELMSVYGLQQYVNEPTRFNALLDLLLSNDENVIVHTNVCPGISDHNCVVAELNVSRIPACTQPLAVFSCTTEGTLTPFPKSWSCIIPLFYAYRSHVAWMNCGKFYVTRLQSWWICTYLRGI